MPLILPGCGWLPLPEVDGYASVQFSSRLKRDERTVAKITNTDVIVLSVQNSTSAIIIFIPNLCRLRPFS
ncbi:MAG: hypothetical protein GY805_11795 [Chloroflexi bacterium]|nr:hypothetical protein [Chloroflexota bacterium]